MSPTHFTPGLLAVKFRRTRSGREPRSAAGTVVRTFRRGCAATRPCSRMMERTVSRSTTTPLRHRAAVMRRYPQVPSEALNSVLMKSASLRLLVVVADSGLLRQL